MDLKHNVERLATHGVHPDLRAHQHHQARTSTTACRTVPPGRIMMSRRYGNDACGILVLQPVAPHGAHVSAYAHN
jgi:hypothetical protein